MKKILDKIKLIGFILFLGLGLAVGFYFSFQSDKLERDQKKLFLRRCFNQNYNYANDNPEKIVEGCKRLYNKQNNF